MRLRVKLLLLFLCLSVIPIVVLRYNGRSLLEELGVEIGSRISRTMMSNARRNLERLVEDHARMLGAERKLVEKSLAVQGMGVKSLLAADAVLINELFPTADMPGATVPRGGLSGGGESSDSTRTPAELQDAGRDASPPDGQVDGIEDAALKEFRASVEFSFPDSMPDAKREMLIRRLSPLLPVFRESLSGLGRLVLSMHVRLGDVVIGYPDLGGTGGMSSRRMGMMHGMRSREARAVEGGEAVWTRTRHDSELGRLVTTLSRSLVLADGTPVGNVSMVVAPRAVLENTDNLPGIPANISVLFARVEPGTDGPAFSVRSFDREKGFGMMPEYLMRRGESDPVIESMAEAILSGKTGVVSHSYKGSESLWAFAPLDREGGALLLSIPVRDLIREAEGAREYVSGLVDRQVASTGVILGSIVLLVILLAMGFTRFISRDILKISRVITRVGEGDFSARTRLTSRDEVGMLGRNLDAMIPGMEEHLRMRSSLELAMQVQQRLLPARPPESPGLDAAGLSIYCEETGGDYYDFIDIPRPEGRPLLIAAVGDVSGHGIPAALLMASARAGLRAHLLRQDSPLEAVRSVNARLVEDLDGTGQFMTLFLAEMDRDSGTLRWVRAGHDPALLYTPPALRSSPEEEPITELFGTGLPLGVIAGAEYEQQTLEGLRPGHAMLIGTDGIWEAVNEEGDMFGRDRLRGVFAENADRPAREIVSAVIGALEEFLGRRVSEDDATLVVIRVE